jgi:hypothetical protein
MVARLPFPWQFELIGNQFNEMIRGLAKLAALELDQEGSFGTDIASNACWQNTYGKEWCGEFEAKETLPAPKDVLIRDVDWPEPAVRLTNALCQENIETIGDLISKTEAELLRVPNFGRRSLASVKSKLASMGLQLTNNRTRRQTSDSTGES